MFDATKGQQAVTDQVETRSDEFAARFNELKPRQQLTLLEQFNQLLDSPDQVSAFQAGTYAQNSSGQPAAQLGTGSQSDPRQQMTEALNAFGASQGQAQAILRILNAPGDPGHLEVDDRGNPIGLVTAERERDTAKTERDAARVALLHERDPNRDGSLAKQLAAVTAERDAAQATAGGYDQAAARTAAQALHKAIRDLTSSRMSNEVTGKDEALAKFKEFAQAVGLRRQP